MAEKIDVDLDGLQAFRDALHDSVVNDLRPTAIGIVRESEPDLVNYGVRMATPAMTSARIRLHDSLDRSLDNLRTYVNTSQALIAALDGIVAAYATADGVTVEAAKQMLADARMATDTTQKRYDAYQTAAAHVSIPSQAMPTDGGIA